MGSVARGVVPGANNTVSSARATGSCLHDSTQLDRVQELMRLSISATQKLLTTLGYTMPAAWGSPPKPCGR